jgi:hypothetical protein
LVEPVGSWDSTLYALSSLNTLNPLARSISYHGFS